MPERARDERFMAACLRLGRRGLGATAPNPSVGCLIIGQEDGGDVVLGRGVTAPGGRPHAEVRALLQAGARARGAEVFVTLEPCSHYGKTGPCAEALVAAGVRRVVSALEDPDPRVAGRGHDRLRAAGIEVVVGVGAEAAARDHAGHVARTRHGRPHVTLKLAMTADGALGQRDRRLAITGAEAERAMHGLRLRHDGILVGAGTVRIDDPLLTVRLPGVLQTPWRIVIDPRASLRTDTRLALTARDVPVHVLVAGDAPRARVTALEALGVQVHAVPPSFLDARALDLKVALRTLAKLGLTRLLVEGGAATAARLLNADLVDELWLLESPHALGPLPGRVAAPVRREALPPGFVPDLRERYGADTLHSFRRQRSCSPAS